MKYDVIVVGGGHAGIEAALAAAKMGAKTALFVIKLESIGRMSCNPSVGGPAKGHLCREIDALGGSQAYIADLSGIQFRMLNQKKGPAVWAPRSQNDRALYNSLMVSLCENQDGLDIIESTISEINVEAEKVTGVTSNIGRFYKAPKVILANGTFLKGRIHIGKANYPGGRSGEPSAEELSGNLTKLGFNLARFKTGTPARIDLRTIDYSKLEEQPGDVNPSGFSYYKDVKLKNTVSCWLTHTNQNTHKIIQDNLKNSSLYGGSISGVGPRYCPSIEDKIVKFSEKNQHHVFIEPEGENTFEAYVNGVSNSLPPKVQEDVIHSIAGLEKAKFIRYAYAIEYDYIIPNQLKPSMESKLYKGLYLAGQINGTSGYEEAAAQGLVAGINAVSSLNNKPDVIFERSNSYIGVLCDDLVTRGTNEPYRMFTSRAEYRLFLRQDNADQRLMPIGYKLGLVSDVVWQKYLAEQKIIERELEKLRTSKSSKHPSLKEPTKLANILKRPEISFEDLADFGYELPSDVTENAKNKISIEIKYDGYLKRQLADIERFNKQEHELLPQNIDYMQIQAIAYEAREKLNKIKPQSLGQASRIPGVNHTDLNALMVWLKKNNLK